MKSVYLTLVAISLFAFSGCDPNVIKEKNIEIPQYIWNLDFKPTFEVEIEDTVQRYNIWVNVRHTTYFGFSNLWVRVTTTFPDSTKMEDNVNLPLADNGKWFGDCLGDICDAKVMIKQDGIFPHPGKYTFQLEQIMRQDNLPLVMSVGLRVEKAEKKIGK